MKITVYTTSTCPYCEMLMGYLRAKGVSFEEKSVDQDHVARDEMTKISGGFLGVPFTVIERDGEKNTVVGFDKNRLERLLVQG